MSSSRMSKYIETCRSDFDDEPVSVSKEVIDFLDRAEGLISRADENSDEFLNSFSALKQELRKQLSMYADMLSENNQLGWTFSSTRSSIEYDRKIEHLTKVNDVFEQMLKIISEDPLKAASLTLINQESLVKAFKR